MYVYIRMYVLRLHVHARLRVYVRLRVHVRLHARLHAHVRLQKHVHVRLHVHAHVRLPVHVREGATEAGTIQDSQTTKTQRGTPFPKRSKVEMVFPPCVRQPLG